MDIALESFLDATEHPDFVLYSCFSVILFTHKLHCTAVSPNLLVRIPYFEDPLRT